MNLKLKNKIDFDLAQNELDYEVCSLMSAWMQLFKKKVPYCEQLHVLELDECPIVELFGNTWHFMHILYLSCTGWTSLPSDLGELKAQTLWVSECYSLTSLLDWLAHRPTYVLLTLIINKRPLLKELPGGMNGSLLLKSFRF